MHGKPCRPDCFLLRQQHYVVLSEDKHSYFLQSTLVMCIQMQMAFLAMLCCFYVHGITYMRAYLFLVLSVLKGPSDLIKKCFVGVQGKTKIQNVESGFLIRTQNFRIFWMYMDGDISYNWFIRYERHKFFFHTVHQKMS